jgi:uncharacterized membrane protein
MNDSPSEILQFIGRLHPMLVHLPIGFIVLLVVLETLALLPKFKHAASANRTIIVLSLPVVCCSAGCGWVLSWSGGYDEQVLAWHKWLGTSLAPGVTVLLLLHWRGWLRAYRVCLFATAVLLAVAGHFGASLTHGSDYLFPFKKSSVRSSGFSRPEPPEGGTPNHPSGRPVFATVVQPIFKEYCVACHGPEKSKGKLRLDTAENVFKGGDSGPVIEPGNTAQSLMMKRLHLPPDADDHMPPSGKRQPLASDIALVEWWISVGAPVSKTVEELKMPEGK